uniref:Uncharacterized protein n=1 Tax=Tephrocybe rancida TaxID=117070 RepID=A0A386TY83_9AGAR|nr:hypothetical protein DXG01_000029 [Tephrocybe rancida]YP_009517274.1 hypothetical protein DXG01_000030 [Tephrocybe rancida]AYE93184.1 hypothetical protein DXG01_000029 [Tephrocybe rancida]AYE93185.1 hypothetical protein DXG01_000030 [Tephrocybe rancida]
MNNNNDLKNLVLLSFGLLPSGSYFPPSAGEGEAGRSPKERRTPPSCFAPASLLRRTEGAKLEGEGWRTWKGVHKGLTTKTLSSGMLEFQQKPLIRVIRVLGGVSWLAILGKSYIKLNSFGLYVALFFVIIFFIYQVYVTINRFIYIRRILKSNVLDIKISPLDRYASLIEGRRAEGPKGRRAEGPKGRRAEGEL